MSRLSRAWRELRQSDKDVQSEYLGVGFYGYRGLSEIREPLREIATALTKIERRKRRPRIVQCEHPELHNDVDLGVLTR